MKKLYFHSARFLGATLDHQQLPTWKDQQGRPLPEIAIVGRSNVGKSSLINHLLKQKNLAYSSATPGKTQTINFFMIDEQLVLVDLPGYGFASVSRSLQKTWAPAIDQYLQNRPSLVLLLIDARRAPSLEDEQIMTWATHYKIPLLILRTKGDKIETPTEPLPYPEIPYSIKDPKARTLLIHRLNELL